MTKVLFSTGEEGDFKKESSFFEVLKAHDRDLLKKSVAVKVDGALKDLGSALGDGGPKKIEAITVDTAEAREILRHSAAHVLAEAVQSLYPGVKVTIGPAIEDGFYYDFDVEKPFTPEDLEKIEARMKEIIKGDHQFKREDMSRAEALELFRGMGEGYKEEIISGLDAEDFQRLQAVRLRRPLQGAAPPVHRLDKGVQAHRHGWGLLEGRREEQDAPEGLRHGLFHEGRAQGLSGED